MQDEIAARHCGQVLRKSSEKSKCIHFGFFIGQSSQSGYFAWSRPFFTILDTVRLQAGSHLY